tara:strand:- start:16149 stop:17375 length:1227 start_codon:yes stop_codon:yes gene_type:complete
MKYFLEMNFKQTLQTTHDSFYVYNEDNLVNNFNEFLKSFKLSYDNVEIAYSFKTNYLPEICKKINDLGGIYEVVSEMELDLALKLENKKKIIFNGPYKTKEAIMKSLLNDVIIHIDSLDELNIISELLTSNEHINCNLGIRLNLSFASDSISRFGICQSEIKKILKLISSNNRIELKGISCHLPNRDLKSFEFRTKEIIKIYDFYFKNKIQYIDLGGGFPSILQEDLMNQLKLKNTNIKEFAKKICSILNQYFNNSKIIKKPKLILEPGTALVANTMSYYSKIISEKKIKNKIILSSSGSKFNFLGTNNSNLNFPFTEILNPEFKSRKFRNVDIAGYTCIENDYLLRNISSSLIKGDYIKIEDIGSYSIVMKPPFISPNVPIFKVFENKILELKRKETFQDVFNTFLI